MARHGEPPTKAKRTYQMIGLGLLAAVSFSVAGFALVERHEHDGSLPRIVDRAMKQAPGL